MKKKSLHAGKRVAVALAALVFAGLGTAAIHESRSGHRGPLSAGLGNAFNQALLAASKFGMGLSEVYDESQRPAAGASESLIAAPDAGTASPPQGICVKSEPAGFMAKQSRDLHKASRDAFISAQKVEIYGK